ncbi:allatostatin-A receptor-like [Lytechinus variegatus]|uniref:allatostatin-A receptor-like n=1 Tax=Lytechinus variegatus TaxID=7654 RepID=UPI001BB25BF5|nr:allatostatin-A receptor-like [Lytechinus variegatus]
MGKPTMKTVIIVATLATVAKLSMAENVTSFYHQTVTLHPGNPFFCDDAMLTTVSDFGETSTIATTETEQVWVWSTLAWPWWTILQLVSAIVGLVGNLLVIIVTFQRRSTSRSTDILVGNLAIADFLTSLLLIPRPQAARVPNTSIGNFYCKLVWSAFFRWTAVSASIYTLMTISFDRFFAVVYPLRFNRIVNRRLVSYIVVCVWLLAVLIPISGFIMFRVDVVSQRCVLKFPTVEGQVVFGCFVFATRLAIPALTMLITQVLIARELQKQSLRFKSNKGNSQSNASFHIVARNRVLKLMAIVIVIYIITWGPNQTAFFGLNVGLVSSTYFFSPFYRILNVLAFYNSCANPIIYAARFPQFRVAVKGLFVRDAQGRSSIFEQDTGNKPKTGAANNGTSSNTLSSNNTLSTSESAENKA